MTILQPETLETQISPTNSDPESPISPDTQMTLGNAVLQPVAEITESTNNLEGSADTGDVEKENIHVRWLDRESRFSNRQVYAVAIGLVVVAAATMTTIDVTAHNRSVASQSATAQPSQTVAPITTSQEVVQIAHTYPLVPLTATIRSEFTQQLSADITGALNTTDPTNLDSFIATINGADQDPDGPVAIELRQANAAVQAKRTTDPNYSRSVNFTDANPNARMIPAGYGFGPQTYPFTTTITDQNGKAVTLTLPQKFDISPVGKPGGGWAGAWEVASSDSTFGDVLSNITE